MVAFKEIDSRNIHAEVITLFIRDLLDATGTMLQGLDAIAVSCGPGSYTGLRIGVSTAKGLCFALDKPLIAIETLEAMAFGVITYADIVARYDMLCPMIDARRMEVYTAIFSNKGERLTPTSADIITNDSFRGLLSNNRILFFGDGAAKCQDVLGVTPNAAFMPGFVNSAVHLTQKAWEKFLAQRFEDVAYFEPYYLKDFIAGKKAL